MDQWFAVDFFDHKKHLCLNIEYMKSQFVTSKKENAKEYSVYEKYNRLTHS